MRLAEGVGDPHQRFWALVWRATTLTQAGRLEEADRILADLYEIVGRVQDPRLRFVAAAQQAWRAQLAGRIDEAERLAEAALALGQDAGEPDAVTLFAAQLIPIRWHQGRLAEEAGLADFIVVSAPQVGLFRALSALAAYEAGDHAEAQRLLAATAESAFELPRDPVRLGSWCIWAELATQLGDRGAAAILLTHLQGLRDCVVTEALGTFGVVSRCVGSLAGTLGRPDEADAHFRHALAAHERMGAASLAARTAYRVGRDAGRRRPAAPTPVCSFPAVRRPRPEGLALPEGARATRPRDGCWRSARPWSADGLARPRLRSHRADENAPRSAGRRRTSGAATSAKRRARGGSAPRPIRPPRRGHRPRASSPGGPSPPNRFGKPGGPLRPLMALTAGDPQMAFDASIPDVIAASTEPTSSPLRVQSPARTRLSRPLWPGQSRCSTVPGGVST